MFKKELQVKLKNTLRDAPLVPDSVNSVLNREEILSVQDKVLACNSPEVDLLQSQTGEQNLRVSAVVFVLNIRGFPLMLIFPKKARLLFLIVVLQYFNIKTLSWKKGKSVNSSLC